ncbi:MAG TPA: DUF6571 family protein [Mycobacteriales bacterium]|nr:DUF6571 family protein [Mycobacteriales bacterium]
MTPSTPVSTAFPYPTDDPADVAVVVAGLRSGASALAEAARQLRARADCPPPGWRSADGDAALAEIGRLAGLATEGLASVRSAAAALSRYRAALASARGAIDGARGRYEAALLTRQREVQRADAAGRVSGSVQRDWAIEFAAAQRGRDTANGELAAVAAETARVLQTCTTRLGAASGHPPSSAELIRVLADRLPIWEQVTAEQQARAAARALDPARLRERGAGGFARIMRTYAAWQNDPYFARTLLDQLGADQFRTLLTDAVPPAPPPTDDPALRRALDGYYGFLGSVLGAGAPAAAWLDRLLHGIVDDQGHWLRIGLGLALRHGTYQAATIDRIAPQLYAARHDLSLDIRRPFGDPLIGVMHALATNPEAAQRFLAADPSRVAGLLERQWPEDDGTALGTMLAATAGPRNDSSILVAETTVRWLGHHSDSAPLGIATGLGALLGGYVDDVNQGLINTNADAPMRENPLPPFDDGPHAHFGQRDLAHAIYVAMHTVGGSANLYAHQAVYAAAQLSQDVVDPGPSTTLAGLSINYGRLSKIHELAVHDVATRDSATEAERLHNSTTWIHMATMAAGMIPIPGISKLGRAAGIAIGVGRGSALASISGRLTKKFYAEPLAAYSQQKDTGADRLAGREEAATRGYVDSLARRLIDNRGGTSTSSDPDRWISSDLIGSGRDNAESVLLPEIAQRK